MKPVILNDTKFRLFEYTLGGFDDNHDIHIMISNKWYDDIWSNEIRSWLNEYTPGWTTQIQSDNWENGRVFHKELHLVFKTPEDAVAFRLVWM